MIVTTRVLENNGIIFSPKNPGQVCNANLFLVCSQLRNKRFSVATISWELTTSARRIQFSHWKQTKENLKALSDNFSQ